MGLFMTQTFAAGRWSASEPASTPFLTVEVHDSDIAIVTYAPAPASGGLVYLGFQPRDYFEDPKASPEIDLDEQAAGLASWAKGATGASVEAASIRPLLAEDGVEEALDDFVEETAERLCALLGLPPIPLTDDEV